MRLLDHWRTSLDSSTPWSNLNSSSVGSWMRSTTSTSINFTTRKKTKRKAMSRSSLNQHSSPSPHFKSDPKTPTFTTVSITFSAPKTNLASATLQRATPSSPKRGSWRIGKSSEVRRKDSQSKNNDQSTPSLNW